MSIIDDLKADINMSSMIDRLCESKQVSREEACDIIKGLSLSEYIQLEASVDLGGGSGLGGSIAPSYVMQGNRVDPRKLNTNDRISYYDREGRGYVGGEVVRKVGSNGWDVKGADGRTITVNQDDLRGPQDDELDSSLAAVGDQDKKDKGDPKDKEGYFTKARKAAQFGYQKFKSGYKSTRNPTEDVGEDTEIARMKELAGIDTEEVDETSSAGATSAGGIASMPSVVGDTAHTPTDTLRANQRRKKRKKKK